MTPSKPLPTWLAEADPSYIDSVVEVLHNRELKRSSAAKQKDIPKDCVPVDQEAAYKHYSVAIGAHSKNREGNRYIDVFPYDRTRVAVDCDGACGPDGRYLNASWVRELYGGKWWIAQQAPKPNTVHAFITMLLHPTSFPPAELHPRSGSLKSSVSSRIRTVVQLETQRSKADPYFPSQNDSKPLRTYHHEDAKTSPSYQLSLDKTTTISDAHAVHSVVSVQRIATDGSRIGSSEKFDHFLFTAWPDHGVPANEALVGFLHFIKLVDQANRDSAQPGLDPDPPIMVNCSAGIGRTGTLIALTSLLRDAGFLPPTTSILNEPDSSFPPLAPSVLSELPEEYREDKVAQEVDSLREQRPQMLQGRPGRGLPGRRIQIAMVYEVLKMAYEQVGK